MHVEPANRYGTNLSFRIGSLAHLSTGFIRVSIFKWDAIWAKLIVKNGKENEWVSSRWNLVFTLGCILESKQNPTIWSNHFIISLGNGNESNCNLNVSQRNATIKCYGYSMKPSWNETTILGTLFFNLSNPATLGNYEMNHANNDLN
jgi:hypothetical protein